ncbi:MAG: Pyruvate kinase [Alphaproteobacteria bacterium MarineAlpha5_Bin9]|nr:MAG: Pyruvate kinase [Alphaproteobacteria bacterium MarineAlpha5_Bin9]|tara:strand:- start:19938 stop:21377 length:1440 start_codon:yes stop_codon:yes gene_type:complete
MKRERKAKIIATLGPSSSNEEIIEKLFLKGADVFRLNFSHGTIEDHRKNVENIRKLESKYNHASCILADLQGPKLRIGKFKKNKEQLKKGQKFTLDLSNELGDSKRVNFPHPEIYKVLTPNSNILINDGRLVLQVIEQYEKSLITEVINTNEISDNKGVNIPDTILPISSLTLKDKSDIAKALEMDVDWIAISFVQTAKDVEDLKKLISNRASIMAKIEKPSAVKNLKEILEVSDGIMIARGDLGVELPPEKVPVIQKEIIQNSRNDGKPVVVATQMLESMIYNYTPTRAEASDVANAIYDGADAVMLSGESAIGKYPEESVAMMNRIVESVEVDKNYNEKLINIQNDKNNFNTSTDAITSAAFNISQNAQAKAIVTFSVSGRTTLRMAKERAPVQVVGISPNIKTARKMQVCWGINSCHGEDAIDTKAMVSNACKIIKDKQIASPNDSIVITAGVPFGSGAGTNLLRIAKIIADKDLN